MKEQQHLNNDKEAMMQHYKAQREARQRQRQQAQLKTRLLAVAGLVFVVVLFFSLKGCTDKHLPQKQRAVSSAMKATA